MEAEKAANPSSSSTKDLGPCGKQGLLPLRENNPKHNKHHHNDNNDHNNDNDCLLPCVQVRGGAGGDEEEIL